MKRKNRQLYRDEEKKKTNKMFERKAEAKPTCGAFM
jgi:hypothetical protein